MKLGKVFKDGIAKNNPVFVAFVGACSVLAISTQVTNAIGMGLSVIFVLVCSNIVVSLLRNFIPDDVRIPAYIVVIATFVTLLQMFLQAYVPVLYSSLGLFLPLIVVNCIILARAEAFANQNGVLASIVDGFGQGLGYAIAITVIAVIRELLGAGTLVGMRIIPEEFTIGILTQPPAAFIIYGLVMAVFRIVLKRSEEKKA